MLRLVNEWNGKEIKFPTRSVFTIQGKDTVDFEFKDADYKVVPMVVWKMVPVVFATVGILLIKKQVKNGNL